MPFKKRNIRAMNKERRSGEGASFPECSAIAACNSS